MGGAARAWSDAARCDEHCQLEIDLRQTKIEREVRELREHQNEIEYRATAPQLTYTPRWYPKYRPELDRIMK
jgi:hypothetical protein